ncbi:MAG TPA: amino acid adenylation domain-containing protein [Bacteroidota bacterium]|nr:amino acid adenylation domain-containing protein [Bacteroidota bacterium]
MADQENKESRRSGLSASKQELLAKRLAGTGRPASAIPRRERPGPFALSFAQQRLWFIDRMSPGAATYNVPYAYRLQGGVETAHIERALSDVVRRHEILRTTFSEEGGTPRQTVHEPADVRVAVVDLAGVHPAEKEMQAGRILRDESHRGFDLRQGPLMRATLVRLGPEDQILVIVFHHIVFDGWSEGLFFRELSAFYDAASRGVPAELSPMTLQYGDYVLWQRERLQGEMLEHQLAYWREKLGGTVPVLDLPADRPRPPRPGEKGTTEFFTLPADVSAALVRLSQKEGVTLFMTLVAGFATLLARYSGQEDVVIGTPIAGRTRMELEQLAGFFVNTLALRTDLSGNPTFRELLKRVRDVALGAFEHQEVPFEKLVEELHPRRSLAHSPLFQVMFVLQSAPEGEVRLGGRGAAKIDLTTETAKFDITLSMMERRGEIVGWLQCADDLFDPATIRRMAEHLATLLAGIAADPGRTLWQIPLMSDAERETVTLGWNETAGEYPRDASIHRVFEEVARRSPAAVALEEERGETTYGELNARANRIASALRERGVGAGSYVGLAMERSADLVAAMLGILKAGGAYVPLDPSYPRERRAFMMADAGVRVVVTKGIPAHGEFPEGVAVLALDTDAAGIDAQPADDLPHDGEGGQCAYVMYTSGSTGTPKGVAVPHRGVLRLAIGADYARLDAREVFLLFAPVSFDASTFEIWGALLNGARLAIFPAGLPSLEDLGRFIRARGVTTLWLTVSLFHQMVEGPLELLGGVRQLLTGGDVIPVPQVKKFLGRHPECRLVNCYGPTENTTFTTAHTIRAMDTAGRPVPIGRPVRNTRVYILDSFRQPVPVGVPGELYAAGDGLATGYVGRDALTAEQFVAVPEGILPRGRMYRTGDIARWRPDGTIEFMGRADNQVKIRGFRIEPGEIEAVLAQHDGVREAVIIARPSAGGDKRLTAYCVLHRGAACSEEDLRAYLRSKLPPYMVPPAFVFMDAFPRTPSGKTDRALLPDPGEPPSAEAAADLSPVESGLAEIFAGILGRARIGADEDFFTLGGHSLLAMQAVSRIRDNWQVDLPLSSLFEFPTVRGLAQVIEEKLLDQIEKMSDEEAEGRAT